MASVARVPVIIASSFAPHVGGVEELTRRLAIEQRARGASTVIVTNRYPKNLPERDSMDGVPVYRIRFRVPEPRPRHLAGWLVGTLRSRRSLKRILHSAGCDMLHVQCVSNNGYYALRSANETGLPLVVSLQGELSMDANHVYQRSAQLRRTWRALMTRADVVTGCSAQVIDEAIGFYGEGLEAKVRVVPNGIDARAVRAAKPEPWPRPYLFGIGRLVPQKGFDLLIDAFAALSSEIPEIDLVIAGDGPERVALEERARTVAGRVHLVGSLPSERAFAFFRGASGFVLPSRHEPQGIVVLEAMAAGAPVVAACVGGVAETVRDGENGLLFEGGNVAALTSRLRLLVQDPIGAGKRACRAAVDVERYSWSKIADEYDACYRDANESRRRRLGMR